MIVLLEAEERGTFDESLTVCYDAVARKAQTALYRTHGRKERDKEKARRD